MPGTRERILRAAVDEFAAHGYGGARIARIAAAAGANKERLYHYFRSKDGLFEAAVDDAMRQIVAAEPFHADDLGAYLGAMLAFHRAHPQLLALLLAEGEVRRPGERRAPYPRRAQGLRRAPEGAGRPGRAGGRGGARRRRSAAHRLPRAGRRGDRRGAARGERAGARRRRSARRLARAAQWLAWSSMRTLLTALVLAGALATGAVAKTSHAGWPVIDGDLK